MKKSGLMALAAGAAVAASTAAAFAFPGQQLAPQANVSLARARSIALHAAQGSIVSQELEREKGGSGLRYTFDIETSAGVREVGVDAKTGAILENIQEKGGD